MTQGIDNTILAMKFTSKIDRLKKSKGQLTRARAD